MDKTFSVRMDGLHQAKASFRRSYLRLNENLEELEAVRRRLAGLSGMDGCVGALKRAKGSMEDALFVLGQMNKALERTAELYPAAEARVIHECENLNAPMAQQSWGNNDFQSIRRELTQFALF